MDVYAKYTAYPQSGIEKIKTQTDGQTAPAAEYGLDKLWDAVHFVLTGKGSDDADMANPASKAVIGNILRQDEEAGEHVGWLSPAETAEAARALNQTDFAALLAGKGAQDFTNAQIYPGNWSDGQNFAALREEMARRFQEFTAFYQNAAAQNHGVIVRIS